MYHYQSHSDSPGSNQVTGSTTSPFSGSINPALKYGADSFEATPPMSNSESSRTSEEGKSKIYGALSDSFKELCSNNFLGGIDHLLSPVHEGSGYESDEESCASTTTTLNTTEPQGDSDDDMVPAGAVILKAVLDSDSDEEKVEEKGKGNVESSSDVLSRIKELLSWLTTPDKSSKSQKTTPPNKSLQELLDEHKRREEDRRSNTSSTTTTVDTNSEEQVLREKPQINHDYILKPPSFSKEQIYKLDERQLELFVINSGYKGALTPKLIKDFLRQKFGTIFPNPLDRRHSISYLHKEEKKSLTPQGKLNRRHSI